MTVVSAEAAAADQLLCTVCVMDSPKIDVSLCRKEFVALRLIPTKPFHPQNPIFNESTCKAYWRTGAPVKTKNAAVTFNKNFGRTKSDQFSNQTTLLILQLWSGEPSDDSKNIIATGFAGVGEILVKGENGKERTFVQQAVPDTGIRQAKITYKVQFNAAFSCLTTTGFMLVTLLAGLWSQYLH